jgi:hypothetical protein
VSDSITTYCHLDYRAAHDSGSRAVSKIKWIVLHSTEGSTAKGAAEWFQNPASGGSAHLVVDDTICYRTLPNSVIPWGAPGANTFGFHIEQAGFAHWGTAEWMTHPKTIERAAYKAAIHCKLFGIPVKFIDHSGLIHGFSGITTHAECTKAFGGDHTDPGMGYPMAYFLKKATAYRAAIV